MIRLFKRKPKKYLFKGFVVTPLVQLNVRSGAGVDKDIIDKINPGKLVKVCRVAEKNRETWFEIKYGNKCKGWIYSDFLIKVPLNFYI